MFTTARGQKILRTEFSWSYGQTIVHESEPAAGFKTISESSLGNNQQLPRLLNLLETHNLSWNKGMYTQYF